MLAPSVMLPTFPSHSGVGYLVMGTSSWLRKSMSLMTGDTVWLPHSRTSARCHPGNSMALWGLNPLAGINRGEFPKRESHRLLIKGAAAPSGIRFIVNIHTEPDLGPRKVL